jgi:hypothetical protein
LTPSPDDHDCGWKKYAEAQSVELALLREKLEAIERRLLGKKSERLKSSKLPPPVKMKSEPEAAAKKRKDNAARDRDFKRPFSSRGKVLLGSRAVKHAGPWPGIGAFSGPSSARGAMFRSVLASRASEGQGGGSAQGLNRMGAGIGGGSGQVESIEGPGRGSGRCPGGQAEMGENLGDRGGL